jgi:hypothetical protein
MLTDNTTIDGSPGELRCFRARRRSTRPSAHLIATGDVMRNVPGILILVLSIGLALVGCSRPSTELTPAPAAPSMVVPQSADVVCTPPQRRCLDCNGNLFCARQCPFSCPAPLAPEAEDSPVIAELTPGGEQCGSAVCGLGKHCCNASCSLCTPKGVECTQQTCD